MFFRRVLAFTLAALFCAAALCGCSRIEGSTGSARFDITPQELRTSLNESLVRVGSPIVVQRMDISEPTEEGKPRVFAGFVSDAVTLLGTVDDADRIEYVTAACVLNGETYETAEFSAVTSALILALNPGMDDTAFEDFAVDRISSGMAEGKTVTTELNGLHYVAAPAVSQDDPIASLTITPQAGEPKTAYRDLGVLLYRGSLFANLGLNATELQTAFNGFASALKTPLSMGPLSRVDASQTDGTHNYFTSQVNSSISLYGPIDSETGFLLGVMVVATFDEKTRSSVMEQFTPTLFATFLSLSSDLTNDEITNIIARISAVQPVDEEGTTQSQYASYYSLLYGMSMTENSVIVSIEPD